MVFKWCIIFFFSLTHAVCNFHSFDGILDRCLWLFLLLCQTDDFQSGKNTGRLYVYVSLHCLLPRCSHRCSFRNTNYLPFTLTSDLQGSNRYMHLNAIDSLLNALCVLNGNIDKEIWCGLSGDATHKSVCIGKLPFLLIGFALARQRGMFFLASLLLTFFANIPIHMGFSIR